MCISVRESENKSTYMRVRLCAFQSENQKTWSETPENLRIFIFHLWVIGKVGLQDMLNISRICNVSISGEWHRHHYSF